MDIIKRKVIKKHEKLDTEEKRDQYLRAMSKYYKNNGYKAIETILGIYLKEQGLSNRDIDKFRRRDSDYKYLF